MKKKGIAMLAAVAVMAVYATAATTMVEPSVVIFWEPETGQGGQVTLNADNFEPFAKGKGPVVEIIIPGCAKAKGLLKQTNIETIGNAFELSDFEFTYDADPFVQGGFSIVNTSNVTQTYTFIFTSPVFPALTPSTIYGGSMSGSFTADDTVPAVVATVAGTPLYWGMIDGVPILPIYSDPQSWSVNAPNSSGTIAAVNVAINNPGPAALSDLSLQFKFTLTPGDTATMNGIFVVLIPEPATISLLGMGVVALLRKRK